MKSGEKHTDTHTEKKDGKSDSTRQHNNTNGNQH